MNEQRKFIRYECDLILALLDETNKVIEAEGRSHNLSLGGLKFSSQLNLDVGSYCKIAFDLKNGYYYAQGNILRKKSIETNGTFDYAMAFDVKLSERELEKLLLLNKNN